MSSAKLFGAGVLLFAGTLLWLRFSPPPAASVAALAGPIGFAPASVEAAAVEAIDEAVEEASTVPHESRLGGEVASSACSSLQKILGTVLWGMVQELNVTASSHDDVLSTVAEVGNMTGRSCFEAHARSLMKVLIFEGGQQSTGWRALQTGLHAAADKLGVNVDGELLAKESKAQSCLVMMSLAALSGSALHAGTAAIEHGTFMGYSTKCIAAGATIAKHMSFYAFDLFNYIPETKSVWKESGMARKKAWLQDPNNYMHQVTRNILPWKAKLVKGPIGSHRGQRGAGRDYDDRDVAFFAMDASKDLEFFIESLGLVSKQFLPNSIMVLGDSLLYNAICGQIGSVLDTLMPWGKVSLLYYSRGTSHTVWLVNEPFRLKGRKDAKALRSSLVDGFLADCTAISKDLYGTDSLEWLKKKVGPLQSGCKTMVSLA